MVGWWVGCLVCVFVWGEAELIVWLLACLVGCFGKGLWVGGLVGSLGVGGLPCRVGESIMDLRHCHAEFVRVLWICVSASWNW